MAQIDDFADSEVVGCATAVADLRNRVGNRCLDATDGRARWIDDCTAYGSPVSLSLPLGEDMPPNSTRIAMTALVRCPLSCVPFLSAAISSFIIVSVEVLLSRTGPVQSHFVSLHRPDCFLYGLFASEESFLAPHRIDTHLLQYTARSDTVFHRALRP